MLIIHIRVMFDVEGQWSKYMEEHLITIKNMLAYFEHMVGGNWILYYIMLIMGCSGF